MVPNYEDLAFCSEGFSWGTLGGFPPSAETNLCKFQLDQDKEPAWKPAKADVASSLNIVMLFSFFTWQLLFVLM